MGKIDNLINFFKRRFIAKRGIKIFYKIFVIFFFILLIILSPLVIFAIQHSLSDHNNLYTYTDKAGSVTGEPVNIIIKNRDIAEIANFLQKEGWRQVPTFSIRNKNTWQFSLGQGITPVSRRYFKGKAQDVSMEGPGSAVNKRHHARFWQVNGSVYGAVSYDSGLTVYFKSIIPMPVHIVSQNIDFERNELGGNMAKGLNLPISYKDNTFPLLYKNNHAGSWYYTDGEALVIGERKQASSLQENILSFRRIYFKILGFILH